MRKKAILSIIMALIMSFSILPSITVLGSNDTTCTPYDHGVNMVEVTFGDLSIFVPEGEYGTFYVSIIDDNLYVSTHGFYEPAYTRGAPVHVATVSIRGEGRFFFWLVTPEPGIVGLSFTGTVGIMNITSGLSSGRPSISGLSGSVAASYMPMPRHIFQAHMTAILFFGSHPIHVNKSTYWTQ